MLRAAITFLVGCLILCIVIYVLQMVLAMLTLPGPVKEIAIILISLILLMILIWHVANVFNGGNTPPL